jgi:hypothetical protein
MISLVMQRVYFATGKLRPTRTPPAKPRPRKRPPAPHRHLIPDRFFPKHHHSRQEMKH